MPDYYCHVNHCSIYIREDTNLKVAQNLRIPDRKSNYLGQPLKNEMFTIEINDMGVLASSTRVGLSSGGG